MRWSIKVMSALRGYRGPKKVLLDDSWDAAKADLRAELNKRGILLDAYPLWANGFALGPDANLSDMSLEARLLGIDIHTVGWEAAFLRELEGLFLGKLETQILNGIAEWEAKATASDLMGLEEDLSFIEPKAPAPEREEYEVVG